MMSNINFEIVSVGLPVRIQTGYQPDTIRSFTSAECLRSRNAVWELGSFLTFSLLMSYIYGAPCKARNFNVVYIWTYVSQR
jgi:hypothetical protein